MDQILHKKLINEKNNLELQVAKANKEIAKLMETVQQYETALSALAEDQTTPDTHQLDEVNVGAAFQKGGIGGALRAFGTNVKNRGIMGALSKEGAFKATERNIEAKTDKARSLFKMGSEIGDKAKERVNIAKGVFVDDAAKRATELARQRKPFASGLEHSEAGKEAAARGMKVMNADPQIRVDQKMAAQGETLKDTSGAVFRAAAKAKERLGQVKGAVGALEAGRDTSAAMHHPFLQGYTWKTDKPQASNVFRHEPTTSVDPITDKVSVRREKPEPSSKLIRTGSQLGEYGSAKTKKQK